MEKTVALLTDFSEASDEAFTHALALALAYKHHFYLLHVKNPGREPVWSSFPEVRGTLARWGVIDADAAQSEVEAKLGIKVAKVEIETEDIPGGILDFILKHPTNVIVMATRGHEGLNRLLYGSKAEEIFHCTQVLPAIFIGPEARGFVDKSNGQIRLERILIPVAHSPSPISSLRSLTNLLAPLGVSSAAFQFMHVGDSEPQIIGLSGQPLSAVQVVQGPVEETILRIAQECQADMIAMPTARHDGFLDALRGSTTERVLRRAPCPVLAIPTR
jgi:nucleotide-binding universal stress UspA family protein